MPREHSILTRDAPLDWDIKKIKYVFDERNETNDPIKTDVLVSLTHDRGVILHSDKGDLGNKEKNDLTKYKLVYPGDIVVNSMNVIIGSSGLSSFYGLVSPVYYMLVTKKNSFDRRFFHYLFRSHIFQKSLIGVGSGILEHRMRISMDKLGNQFIPLPPDQEQQLISRYLDKKTAQIDSLIKKIEKKIELLKEQRTSLINQCVTKGLDPNVEMKDSGVEWIGKIPKNWDVKRLKYISSHNTETLTENTPSTYRFHYIEISDVDYLEGVTINEKIEFGESPSRARRVAKPGDVLISTVRAYLRAVGVVPDIKDIVCSTGFCLIRGHDGLLNQGFLSYAVKSEWFIGKVISESYGVSYPAINASELVNTKTVVPPYEEQQRIASFLDVTVSHFKNIIDCEADRIRLLYEHRQSLISSVVTGKIRVTEDMV
jgi:type I restriction enzyme S subunit